MQRDGRRRGAGDVPHVGGVVARAAENEAAVGAEARLDVEGIYPVALELRDHPLAQPRLGLVLG